MVVSLLQYDEIYTIKLSADLSQTSTDERRLLQEMHEVFVEGLGDRVTLVDFKLPQKPMWALNQHCIPSQKGLKLKMALLINPDTVGRLVDRGPPADEQDEAAAFRILWGEKAELRRFKDGSISEALVWAQGSPVTMQIVAHLAMLHFSLPPSSIEARKQDLELSILSDDESSAFISPKDAFQLIDSTFHSLTTTLHNLQDLPLPIRSISPADPALRSSTTHHPLLLTTTSPINILIQFDSSTRWPDSLPAIQHTKIAFLLKLSELLTSSNPKLTTRVGLENTDSATTGHFNTSFLDIIFPSSAIGLSQVCFRARVHHDREFHLLQNPLSDKDLHGSVRDSLALALATHRRDFQATAIHTLTMKNLITRFPPLSSTIRLLKKWVSSHLLLANHICSEVLEIIASRIFLHPAPWSIPGSSTTAFLRCLHFLSRWDWSSTALMIDLSLSQDGITEKERSEIQTRFMAWRKMDPNSNTVVWFIGTNVDSSGTVWTGHAKPEKVIAGRITALARAAIGVIEDRGTRMRDGDWNGLFQSSLGDFDFEIHLKGKLAKGYKGQERMTSKTNRHGGGGDFKNLQIASTLDTSSIGYDRVELYISDLNHAFRSSALFFHDQYGGKVIAGLWKPSVMGRKEWRVRLGWSSVPLPAEEGGAKEGKQMCMFNKQAVIAEMVRLGDGLVKEVKIKQ